LGSAEQLGSVDQEEMKSSAEELDAGAGSNRDSLQSSQGLEALKNMDSHTLDAIIQLQQQAASELPASQNQLINQLLELKKIKESQAEETTPRHRGSRSSHEQNLVSSRVVEPHSASQPHRNRQLDDSGSKERYLSEVRQSIAPGQGVSLSEEAKRSESQAS
jgi:hypothetical protein